MIVINERFHVERDKLNFILMETTRYVAKSGKNSGNIVSKTTPHYYSNLLALCMACIDQSLDFDGGFRTVLESLYKTEAELKKMITANGLEIRRTIKEAGAKP